MALFHMQGVPIGFEAIMLAVLASMGGFIFGYDTGQISDILLMDDFLARFADSCTTNPPTDPATQCAFSIGREGLIVSLLSIGTLIGALLGAPVADFFGRRKAMSLECCVFTVGVVIQLASISSWGQFAAGRLIAGLGVGGLSAAVPMYQAETAPRQLRGTLTGTYQLFITFGILIAYCISIGTRNLSDGQSWRIVVGIGIIWAAILGIGILFMPESPRWSVAHDKPLDAARSLARTRGLPVPSKKHRGSGSGLGGSDSPTSSDHEVALPGREDKFHDNERVEDPQTGVWMHPIVQRELDEIRVDIERERLLKRGWVDCFKGADKTRYRTFLGMTLQALQQLTGANYFFYYGATIFQSVGIQDSFATQIILGAVNFVSTFGGLYIMERYGRRRPLIIGGLWQSAWLFVFAAAGTAKSPTEDKSIGDLMIVSACLFIFGYAMTWAPGIWILIGETFPTRTRAKQGALSTSANWMMNFLLAFFTPFITRAIGYSYGFVFAGCNLFGAIFVWLFLYESSGLSLENVDKMYNDPDCKPWTSRSWAPEGYASRGQAVAVEKEKARAQALGADPNLDVGPDGASGANANAPSRPGVGEVMEDSSEKKVGGDV